MTSARSDVLGKLDLRPTLGHDLPTLLAWLYENQMTASSERFDLPPGSRSTEHAVPNLTMAWAQETSRAATRRHNKAEISALKNRFRSEALDIDREATWGAVADAAGSVRALDWRRLPADAMAFYRPFHVVPFDQFGIYLLVRPLLDYHRQLVSASSRLGLFSPETLMHLVLFEVFHHEFFHHIVESTATALELLLATQYQRRPVYVPYRQGLAAHGFGHPHAPLEEALANAYAHNSLGFIARVKVGVKTASVGAYQHAIARHWCLEPPGYSSATCYIGGSYVDGATLLVTQLLDKEASEANRVPLGVLAKHVMPSGVTALVAKPEIPTWLVGSEIDIAKFNKLVPAPNETYTQLFWPYNTEKLDRYIADRHAQERAQKRQESSATPVLPQQFDLFGSH